MTDERRPPGDPRDRADAPPDPESGAPVPIPAAASEERARSADVEGVLARGEDIHETIPLAEPAAPGAGITALSLVLPGAAQIATGRAGVGFPLLVLWGVLLGIAALGFERITALGDTGSLDDYVALATLVLGAAIVWVGALWDVRTYGERAAQPKGDSQWRIATRHFSRNPVAVIGLLVIVAFYLIALLAPLIAPYDPIAQRDIARTGYLSPSGEHWLGTDRFGRDVLSRILFGARISLAIAFVATAISITLGTLLGAVGGYLGGKVDAAIMRFTDMVLAFPRLVLLIMIVALFSPSISVIVAVLGLTQWPSTTRIVRGDVLSLREREFIHAARALGFSRARIVLRHLIPNVLAPVIVAATLGIGNTIVLEAGLSFLGLGVPAPTPTWGNMVAEGRDNLLGAWWVATFPGLTIVFVVLAFNLVGDGLRDALDPRLRS
jgi:ABC-type dipeptide/oligopeptide/nickel transport system permease subunit